MTLEEFKDNFNNAKHIEGETSIIHKVQSYIRSNLPSYRLKKIHMCSLPEDVDHIVFSFHMTSLTDSLFHDLVCAVLIDPKTYRLTLEDVYIKPELETPS
jgi:hypothetical protein